MFATVRFSNEYAKNFIGIGYLCVTTQTNTEDQKINWLERAIFKKIFIHLHTFIFFDANLIKITRNVYDWLIGEDGPKVSNPIHLKSWICMKQNICKAIFRNFIQLTATNFKR